MARSPRPRRSARPSTREVIRSASNSTSWNSSGETVTLATSGSLAIAGDGLGRGLRLAEAPRAGDATGLHHQRFEVAGPRRSPFGVLGGADQRLQHHLAVAPVVVLVGENEFERPDGRGVG